MSLYWHDYETFGVDPARDRAAQFAGLRTDEDLNPVGDPLVLYCRPADDMLPHPEACLVTGITPQKARSEGLSEAAFIAKIERELAHPGTCGVGYNSIRFDDEFTRNLLYRNFHDPYAREWQNGCSRWDIIDMMRLMRAFRPEGLEWPVDETGRPSFRLEALTAANGIGHESAHDALSDVVATIDLARRVKKAQPKLYDYVYRYRDKRLVSGLLAMKKPLVHVSAMYPSEYGCTALVLPLALHPVNRNEVIVYDLRHDPSGLLDLDAEEIRRRIFTPKSELDVDRFPVKTIHVNKSPVVASEKLLTPEIARGLGIDMIACRAHAEALQRAEGLADKLAEAFCAREKPRSDDPDLSLYGGFFGNADRAKMDIIRSTSPDALGGLDLGFDDPRIPEMLFRYRARNFPETLSESERSRWAAYRRARLSGENASLRLEDYFSAIAALREQGADPGILQALEEWGRAITP